MFKVRTILNCGSAGLVMFAAGAAGAQQSVPGGPAASASAQAGPAEAVPADQAAPSEAAVKPNASAAAEDIVVTGSRTIRNGAAAPTPVTTVTAQALAQTAPSNIPDALNRLPQFLGSASQYTSATFNATAAPQGNYLNLRGLGSQRVLVLLDGTRVPPTSSSNAVDANIIPQMLVERVDVVTGGASAAYGSDAVSGVVNFVLNKKFKGIEATAQRSISTYGDAPSYRVGLAAGTGFAGDRGHIEASVEHYENDGIARQDDRPLYAGQPLIVGTGAANNPYTQITNARFNDVTFGGLIRSGPLAGNSFNPDGSVSPFVSGTATGTSNVVAGGQGAYVPPTVLVPYLKTTQAFGRASFDFSDSLGAFVQGSYAQSRTGYLSNFATRRGGTSSGITIFSDNPYLTPGVRGALGATPSFSLSRLFSDAPGAQQRSDTVSYNIEAGLNGRFGKGLRWDITYVHGDAILNLSDLEQNNRNFYAAVDAVRGPDGRIVCGVTLRNPSLLPGCAPLNVLGTGNLNPAALAFINQVSRYRIENRLDSISANLRGNLFDLPAGPVAFAIGGEARWQHLVQTSNANPAVPVDYAGIRGVPTGVLPFLSTNVGAANGRQQVKEGYVELNVPVLADMALARRLEINGAARYTDYRTSGSVETWKVGAIYEPVKGLRLRGTVSQDIAAPSLFDLFSGAQATVLTQSDRHTGVTGPLTQITQGNPGLRPERAKTVVVGVVLQPSFLPGFTASVDGYRISIKDAIGTTDAQTQLNDCEASNGTAPVCALITRPLGYSNTSAANFPTQLIVAPRNLATLKVKGIDAEVNYMIPLNGALGLNGRIELRGFASYLDTFDTQASPTAAVIHRAGRVTTVATTAGLPKWRGLLQQGYRNAGFSLQVTERFTGSYSRTTQAEAFDPNYVQAPNLTYVDLYVSQAVGKKDALSLFVQVDNLLNASPPLLPATVNPGFVYPTARTTYSVLGRNFTVGARLKF
jgi:iron complex outermembrane receptor protein